MSGTIKKPSVEVAAIAGAIELAKDLKEWPGIVHESAPIKYLGKTGTLVWAYIIWNELTFVDAETNEKITLYSRFSDKETKAKFDEYVSKYPI